MFDVERFLQDQGIEYVTEGPNTKKGNINVSCPWCGDDPSHHMGIEPNKGWYGCWRSPDHRGKNLARLLAAISTLSYAEAHVLVGRNLVELSTTDLQSIADGRFFAPSKLPKPRVVDLGLPYNFRKLRVEYSELAAKPYIQYLVGRGFTIDQVGRLCRVFGFHYCVSGWWKERIIIPVWMERRLMCWTSRSIYLNAREPYLSLDADSSVINIKECLYNHDSAHASGGEVLFLVEGPGDVWKLDLIGRKYNCRAVGLFSLSCEEGQQSWFDDLVSGFGKLVVLADRNEIAASQKLLDTLAYLRIRIVLGELPKGVKDPGHLTDDQAGGLCTEYLVHG